MTPEEQEAMKNDELYLRGKVTAIKRLPALGGAEVCVWIRDPYVKKLQLDQDVTVEGYVI